MRDITRLLKGPMEDFGVAIVFARNGEASPREAHAFDEIIVITDGRISLERSDCSEPELHTATEMVCIPAGVEHLIRAHETPTRLVIIHPERR